MSVFSVKFALMQLGHDPDGQVAQLVEQRTENPCVGGSNPPLPIPVTFWLTIIYDCRPFFVMGQNGGCATGAQQILTQHLAGCHARSVDKVGCDSKVKAVRRVETCMPRQDQNLMFAHPASGL